MKLFTEKFQRLYNIVESAYDFGLPVCPCSNFDKYTVIANSQIACFFIIRYQGLRYHFPYKGWSALKFIYTMEEYENNSDTIYSINDNYM